MAAVMIDYWMECLKFQYCKARELGYWKGGIPVSFASIRSAQLDPEQWKECAWRQENGMQTAILAPHFAKHPETQESLAPYLLWVKVDEMGTITAHPSMPFPILPDCLQERSEKQGFPSHHDFVLFAESSFLETMQMNPPEWLEADSIAVSDQKAYADELLETMTQGVWQWQFHEKGYVLQEHAWLVPFCDQVDLQLKLENLKSLDSIHSVKNPVTRVLKQKEGEYKEDIWNLDECIKRSRQHFSHASLGFKLSETQRRLLLQSLSLEPGDWLTVRAARGSGKTTLWREVIAHVWIQAALDQHPPPSTALLQQGVLKFQSILQEAPAILRWVTEAEMEFFYRPGIRGNHSQTAVVQRFLERCALIATEPLPHLEKAKSFLFQRLQTAVENYQIGLNLAHSYYFVQTSIERKYIQEGGIEQRLQDAEAVLQKHQAKYRHLQVLQSLWDRQLKIRSQFSKVTGWIPIFKQKRMKRLYRFFEEHFPEESVQGLSTVEMEKRIDALLQRSIQRERSLQDVVLQIQTDLRQFQLSQMRFQTWMANQFDRFFEVEDLLAHLDGTLRQHIFECGLHYWEAEFLSQAGWSQADPFRPYFNPLNVDPEPESIDWLWVEHAELETIPSLLIALSQSKRVIMTGQDENPQALEFSSFIDSFLTSSLSVTEDDQDFEDRLYQGLLASSSGMNLGKTFANFYNPEEGLLHCWKPAQTLIALERELLNRVLEEETPDSDDLPNQDILWIPVQGQSEASAGSRINLQEIKAIVAWLQNHQTSLLSDHQASSLSEVVGIVTPFCGQQAALQAVLKLENLEVGEITTDPRSALKRYPVLLFSSVYTSEDPRPYVFDEGETYLAQMVAKAWSLLVVFGDPSIFESEMCSASGKLARYLLLPASAPFTEEPDESTSSELDESTSSSNHLTLETDGARFLAMDSSEFLETET